MYISATGHHIILYSPNQDLYSWQHETEKVIWKNLQCIPFSFTYCVHNTKLCTQELAFTEDLNRK